MRFRGDLEALILGVLDIGPAHGYEIARRIEEFGGENLKTTEGLLYPALHRLERLGVLAAKWEAQEGKPDRRVYALTESGSTVLEQKRSHWRAFRGSVDKILQGMQAHG